MKFNRIKALEPCPCYAAVVLAQKSPLQDFDKVLVTSEDSDEQIVLLTSDVSLLCNEKRLSVVGKGAVDDFIKSLGSNAPSSSDDLTDEQRFAFIKPRNIQTLSELADWQEYLDDEYNQRVQVLKSKVEYLKKQKEEKEKQKETKLVDDTK